MKTYTNPILNADFPDPDIIRVGDTYYMASTTMHFMPGGDILRSKNLLDWEFAGHAFETLEDNDAHTLQNGKQIFGQGMWAPSLRWHKGKFYLTFSCNDTHKSLLFIAEQAEGPWERVEMGGFYYDSSLFFDEDDRVYIVHGNTTLRLTELDPATWGPKENGLDRVVAVDPPPLDLGYEGSHLYKHAGRYYLFTCHMPHSGKYLKTEDVLLADSLTGEFVPKNILDDDMGYRHLGVAQGGMVETPQGDWYLFMFQDRGALGRAPMLLPMHFDGQGYPAADTDAAGELLWTLTPPRGTQEQMGGTVCGNAFLVKNENGRETLAPWWQFSHNPDPAHYSFTARPGALRITTGQCSPNLVLARNVLTQRCLGPKSAAWVTVDGASLREGDYAGICAYENCYGAIALTRQNGALRLVMLGRPADKETIFGDFDYPQAPVQYADVPCAGERLTLRVAADFTVAPDRAAFAYRLAQGAAWAPLGAAQKLYFKMDFFTGCRFGLFCYATRQAGGGADFTDFTIIREEG